jgi:hypothetical protein
VLAPSCGFGEVLGTAHASEQAMSDNAAADRTVFIIGLLF